MVVPDEGYLGEAGEERAGGKVAVRGMHGITGLIINFGTYPMTEIGNSTQKDNSKRNLL